MKLGTPETYQVPMLTLTLTLTSSPNPNPNHPGDLPGAHVRAASHRLGKGARLLRDDHRQAGQPLVT